MRNIGRPRLLILQVLVVSLLATLGGRLYQLQMSDAARYRAAASDNLVRDIITQPPRGEIVDDQGRPLLNNVSAMVVSVDRTKLNRLSAHDGAVVMRRLAHVLHTTRTALQDKIRLCNATTPKPCYPGSPYQPVPVSQSKPGQRSTTRALQIQQTLYRYDGVVSVSEQPVRHYPQPDGAEASTVLGYIGPITPRALNRLPVPERLADSSSYVGATGLEAEYEKYLHGTPGIKQVAVNSNNETTGIIKNTAPRAGDTLVTNLDAKVQARLERSLKQAIASQRAAGKTADFAAGVVLNVRTGGVVAMASEPTYQPDLFDNGVTPAQYHQLATAKGSPQVDKAYGSAGPPGSTFKLITSSGALWDHIITTGSVEDCSADFQGRHNFEGEAGGVESLHQAIVESCDTWFYRIAAADWLRDENLIHQHKKPIEGVQKIAHDYGLGESPDIDLPGANPGYIPDRKNQVEFWKKVEKPNACVGARTRAKGSELQRLDEYNCKSGYIFEQGDQENEDTGQGMVTVSPLQLAVAYAAIANGGTVWEPKVGRAILSPSGRVVRRIHAKVRDHLPLTSDEMTYLRDAFYGVTTEPHGTGSGVFAGWPMGRFKVGGKTGTAELGNTTQDGAWFASFAGPAGQEPQWVTVIEVDRASQGAEAAAPAAKAMWSAIFGVGEKAIFPDGVPPKKLPDIRYASRRSVRTVHGTSHRPGHRRTHKAKH